MAEFAVSRITLRSHLQRGGLQPREALAIAAEAGRALARAHAAGQVHGSLTGASILLHDSQATIQGFGKAGATVEEVEHLAPERIAGGPPSVPADIYSFGCILEEIRGATSFDPATNRQWEAAIDRSCEPVPDKRFPSVEGVLQAIGADSPAQNSHESSAPARGGVSGLRTNDQTLSFSTATSVSDGPKRWGQFQLLQRMAAGGFGEVYRAWDLTLEREVALKLLLPRGLQPEEEFAAIVAEGRAMARVRHPNSVSVYGVDRHDGRVGLWSDFVRGQTLARWVEKEGPRSHQQTMEIGTALCDALGAVHDAGLLHRDIKPGNAMHAEDGRILLMDFGLSHELHQQARWGGTLDYMAPELLAGGAPSVQSDIYAMGVLLHY